MVLHLMNLFAEQKMVNFLHYRSIATSFCFQLARMNLGPAKELGVKVLTRKCPLASSIGQVAEGSHVLIVCLGRCIHQGSGDLCEEHLSLLFYGD